MKVQILLICLTFITSSESYENLVARYDASTESCTFQEGCGQDVDIGNVTIENGFDENCRSVHITLIDTAYIPIILKSDRTFKEIYMKSPYGVNIREETFEGAKFEEFHLNRGLQPYIADYTFRQVKNLKRIEWIYSHVGNIAKFAFAGAESLTYISLKGNEITEIVPGTFNIETLTELNLDENDLKTIEDRTFEGAVNLRNLSIDLNEVEEISENAFYGLNNLQKLNMQKNGIKNFDPEIFKHTPHLRHLDLHANLISTLHESTFSLTKEIKTIDVGSNSIDQISRKTFENLPHLESLSLLRNVCVDKEYEEMPAGDVLNSDLKNCHKNYEIILRIIYHIYEGLKLEQKE